MRLSVLEPLLFAGIFFVLGLCETLASQTNLVTVADYLWNIGNLFVSCFSATLIPTAVIMIIQQYPLGMDAGLNNKKSVWLLLLLVAYALVFGINFYGHLMWLERVGQGENIITVRDGILTAVSFCLTVFFGLLLWFSLEDNVRKRVKSASDRFNGGAEP